MDLTLIEKGVWRYIQSECLGKSNAKIADEIGRIFHLEQRQVRTVIQNLRNQGRPIASSVRKPKGYYIPVTPEEREEYADQLEARIKSMVIAYHSATRAMPGRAERLGKQLNLDLGLGKAS